MKYQMPDDMLNALSTAFYGQLHCAELLYEDMDLSAQQAGTALCNRLAYVIETATRLKAVFCTVNSESRFCKMLDRTVLVAQAMIEQFCESDSVSLEAAHAACCGDDL